MSLSTCNSISSISYLFIVFPQLRLSITSTLQPKVTLQCYSCSIGWGWAYRFTLFPSPSRSCSSFNRGHKQVHIYKDCTLIIEATCALLYSFLSTYRFFTLRKLWVRNVYRTRRSKFSWRTPIFLALNFPVFLLGDVSNWIMFSTSVWFSFIPYLVFLAVLFVTKMNVYTAGSFWCSMLCS